MKVLSVAEFSDWVCDQAPRDFIFSTENNPNLIRGINMVFHFPLVHIVLNRVWFQNGRDSLTCECVKEVRMLYEERERVGTVFDIVCSAGRGGEERIYRFLAD